MLGTSHPSLNSAPLKIAEQPSVDLPYQPPLDWCHLLAFLGNRSIVGVEFVADAIYHRTVEIIADGVTHRGWVSIAKHKSKAVLRMHASASLKDVLPLITARIERLFDLSCCPSDISVTLGALAAGHEGIRLPGAFDGFELAVRAVLGQQITVRAATTLAGRFAAAFGAPIETPIDGLHRAFPAANKIAALTLDDIARLGIISARARTIITLASHVANGTLRLDPSADIAATIIQLRAVSGIGDWTAQYIAMRALAWPDAFPHTDYGVMKALEEKNPRSVLVKAEAWRPWRAYVVMHLWHSLQAP